MRLPGTPHRWQIPPRRAVELQRRLAGQVVLTPLQAPRLVLGLDCAFLDERILAVGVVWDLHLGALIETRAASAPLQFPYVPGLLSFRELPVLMTVLRRVKSEIDVVMCDGQGIAHPRRFGIAAHLGVITNLPAIGCAKSRLYGVHEAVPLRRGQSRPLVSEDRYRERIGSVLCTRSKVKPLYVSPGHLADFRTAERLVLDCGGGFRLPEPTRLADRLVAKFKRDGHYRGGFSRSK